MVVRLAEAPLRTKYGTFQEILYYDGQGESLAIVMGEVRDQEEVLCRLHSHCVSAHLFNSVECDCREQMAIAQAMVEQAGAGVIIWLDQEGRGNGHLALLRSRLLYNQGVPQSDAYVQLGYPADARQYTGAAAIVRDLGIRSVLLMTNSPRKVAGLQEAGIPIVGTRPVALDPGDDAGLRRFYADKLAQGHRLPFNPA